jgi:hypothetical protein
VNCEAFTTDACSAAWRWIAEAPVLGHDTRAEYAKVEETLLGRRRTRRENEDEPRETNQTRRHGVGCMKIVIVTSNRP